jgi:hypothetical protein
MKKTQKIIFSSPIVLCLLLLFGLTSCDPHGDGGCEPSPFEPQNCTLGVTAVEMSCAAFGVYGNIYFLTDDGRYLQPWQQKNFTSPFRKPKAGERFKIGFRLANRDGRYDSLMRCKLFDPKVEAATPVALECMTAEECSVSATVVDFDCATYGLWGGVWFKTDSGKYLQPLEMWGDTEASFRFKNGQRVKLSYSEVKEGNRFENMKLKLCPTFAPLPAAQQVRINCLTLTDCDQTAVVKDMTGLDGCGMMLVLPSGQKLIPVLDDSIDFKWRDGQKVRFSYTILTNAMTICMAGQVAEIHCISEIEN